MEILHRRNSCTMWRVNARRCSLPNLWLAARQIQPMIRLDDVERPISSATTFRSIAGIFVGRPVMGQRLERIRIFILKIVLGGPKSPPLNAMKGGI